MANVNTSQKGRRDAPQANPDLTRPISKKPASMKDYTTRVLLLQTRDALLKLRQKDLSQYGVSTEQAAVLFIVQAIGGSARIADIARWMLRRPHTVSSLLSRVETKGLVSTTKELQQTEANKSLPNREGTASLLSVYPGVGSGDKRHQACPWLAHTWCAMWIFSLAPIVSLEVVHLAA